MENLHGNIAVRMEQILRKEFGFDDRPYGTIFDADAIEHGALYDGMCLVLCKRKINDREDFANEYAKYKGKTLQEIGDDVENFFNAFSKIIQ